MVFLGGSIDPNLENQSAWHNEMIRLFESIESEEDVTLLNPRRDAWNPDTKISVDDVNFRNQRVWEVDSLENCSFSVFYMDPTAYCDSTMLRLGIVLGRCENVFVLCSKDHRNRADLEVYARLYKSMTLVDTMQELKTKLTKCFS